MIERVGWTRHAVVAAAASAVPVLGFAGVIGGGTHDERFDAKQIVVSPAGDDAVRIDEIVDQDFGTADRHGYRRVIPHDFGIPTDIEASSPDAPDDLDVRTSSVETEIRVGDPSITINGQHRYFLSYTLPLAQLSSGELALDVIGNDETLQTGRFEVVLTGFDLAEAQCNVGAFGDQQGCSFTQDGEAYRAVIEPLEPGEGITVGGPITSLRPAEAVAEPPLPERRADRSGLLGAATLPLGAATGAGAFLLARRRGRNLVGGGGAAAAAHADTSAGTRLVTDFELADMATVEFAPPRGLTPSQAAVLLREHVDAHTVGAAVSELIASEALVVVSHGDDDRQPTLKRGSKLHEQPAAVTERAIRLLGGANSIQLGTYNSSLAEEWEAIQVEQTKMARQSGWWVRGGPGSEPGYPKWIGIAVLGGIASVIGCLVLGLLRSWPATLLLAAVVPFVVAVSAYHRLTPALSTVGSGLTLQAESFRRFLEASEGRHVQWAYENNLLRQYSAWAVALGAADAWRRAAAQAAIAPTEPGMTPLFPGPHSSTLSSTHTKPSSSGSSSSGGGFSSGSVGGGGGGGSSGSW